MRLRMYFLDQEKLKTHTTDQGKVFDKSTMITPSTVKGLSERGFYDSTALVDAGKVKSITQAFRSAIKSTKFDNREKALSNGMYPRAFTRGDVIKVVGSNKPYFMGKEGLELIGHEKNRDRER